MFNDKSQEDSLLNAILSGRFDKKIYQLTNTVILGDDGGIYALLNNVKENERLSD